MKKKQKQSDLKGFTLSDLQERLRIEEAQLRSLRFAHAVSPIEHPLRIRYARRQVARIHTQIRALGARLQDQPTSSAARASSVKSSKQP